LVQTNQILVVRGQVQAQNEAISILVNSAQTKLTVARDAAARGRPDWDAPHDWGNDDPWAGSDMQSYAPMPGSGRASTPVANGPAVNGVIDHGSTDHGSADHGSTDHALAPQVSEAPPASSYAALVTDADDEYTAADNDDYWDDDEPATDEEAMTPPDRAAADEVEPPPAPVVEMPVAPPVTTPAVSAPTPVATPVAAPVATAHQPTTEPPVIAPPGNGVATPSIVAPVNGVLPMPSRILVVEIRASGNWKETCRQSVKLAERYQGNAGLRLQLAGQDLVMDFPDRRIDCAIELVEALERLPGVGRVYEC